MCRNPASAGFLGIGLVQLAPQADVRRIHSRRRPRRDQNRNGKRRKSRLGIGVVEVNGALLALMSKLTRKRMKR